MSKSKRRQSTIKINWLTWALTMFIAISIVLSGFAMYGYLSQKSENIKLQNQIDTLKSEQISEGSPPAEDHLYIEYYRELSDKTDNAIIGMLTIVGIIASIIMIFSTLVAFKAPRDIERRIDELRDETNNAQEAIKKSQEATDEARYQTRISLTLNSNNKAEIICKLSSIIEDYPSSHYAYMMRGNLKRDMGNYDGALSDYRNALVNGIGISDYYYLIASVYYKKENYKEAIQYSTKAINEDDSNFKYYYNRGLSYFFNKNYHEAISDLQKSVELNTENPYACLRIYECYLNVIEKEEDPEKKKKYSELAEVNLIEAFRLFPKDDTISRAKEKWDNEHNS